METLLTAPAIPETPSVRVVVGAKSPVVSFFRAPIQNVRPREAIDLEEVFRRITGNRYAAVTTALRSLEEPGLQRRFKASRLDYVTFSGVFSRRCEEGLLQHSGLLVIDLDHLEDLPAVKQLLLNDTQLKTRLLFTSPSGNGLKWVVECDLKEWTHAKYFQAVANYLAHTYGLKADFSGRDVCRACFLAHDPEARILP